MEKLSERWMFYCGLLVGMNVSVDDLKHIQNLIDAEEQGLLVKLPCNVGDTVYIIRKCSCYNSYQSQVYKRAKCKGKTNISGGANCRKTNCAYVGETKFDLKLIAEIGKTVFLTKEEAEKKLAEMKGE